MSSEKNPEIVRYLGLTVGTKVRVVNVFDIFERDAEVDPDGHYNNCEVALEETVLDPSKIYEIEKIYDDGDIMVDGIAIPWYAVEVVKTATPAAPSFDTNTYTPFYKGREVYYNNKPVTIVWSAFVNNKLSLEIKVNGRLKQVNHSDVRLYPPIEQVRVKLNDEYTATYKKGSDVVKVGCQEIPVEVVLELAKKLSE